MHWPEELVVGGVTRNRSSHLKKAKALQTVVQLMGEREMYEFWSDHYKVHHIGWSPEKAAEILNAWQKKFSAEVHKIMHSASAPTSYDIFAFSSAALDEILGKFSNPNPLCLGIGMTAILIYTAAVLYRFDDPVNGQSSVGVFGVILLTVTTIAGLGFCALLGIPFNAATTQVVPFLSLGLGVDHIFILLHAYATSGGNEQTGQVLKKASLSILFSGTATSGSFFAAALIPVPALRVFCLQVAILLSFNLMSILLIYPAMVSLDLRRRKSGRADILCCCLPPRNGVLNANSQQYHPRCIHERRSNQCVPSEPDEAMIDCSDKNCFSFSISRFSGKYYAPFLSNSSVKAMAMLLLFCIVGISAFAAMKLTDGLELTDLVPQNTDEHKFLSVQGKLFGFYNMFAVTQGDFEYPTNQKLLYEYHEAYVRVSHVIKNDNGGLPEFWLSLFRDWLLNLQKSFDQDYRDGRITQERWYKNASDEAILAYKLLVQTGHVDNPIDKSLVTQVRLVNSENVINPKAFYNYLSAWAWNDGLAYGASQANLRPEPREWFHAPSDFELKIPKSAPLTYTQLPFYLHGLSDTLDIKALIGQIREICNKFEGKGLPNYPSGKLQTNVSYVALL
jgi:patched 1